MSNQHLCGLRNGRLCGDSCLQMTSRSLAVKRGCWKRLLSVCFRQWERCWRSW